MHERRPDLNLLVVFDAVAACRSVSQAALRLSLSQPAVSHALNRLRDLFDDRLFVRGRDGLVPTPRAEAMVAGARAVLVAADAVFAGRGFDPAATDRRFRVAVSDYSALTVLPGLVAACRRLAPGVVLDVVPVAAGTLAEIEAGAVDCTFWGASPPPQMRARVLFDDRLIGLVDRAHPLARLPAGTVSLEDYLAHPHLVVSMRDAGPSLVDAVLARLGRSRRIAVATPSFDANLAALTGTDLVASMPARMTPFAVARGLTPFEIPLDLPRFDYRLLWHRRTDADPGAAWLRERIAEASAVVPAPGA